MYTFGRSPYSPSFYPYDPYELQRIRQAEEYRRRLEELNRRRAEQLEYARRQADFERRQEAEARYRRQQEIEARRRKFSEPSHARAPRVRLAQPPGHQGERPQTMFGGGVQDIFDALYGDRIQRTDSNSYGRRAKSSDPRARQKRVDPLWSSSQEAVEPEGSAVSDTDADDGTVAPAPASTAEPTGQNASGSSTDTKADASIPEANQSQSAISEILKSFSDLKSSFVFPDKPDFLNSPADSDAATPKLAYTPNNAPLHQQEHLLTGLLTKLDAVESFGQESIRKARKDAVLLIERELEELDVKKLQKWREQFKELEAVATVLSDADTGTLGTTQDLSLETRVEADPASIPLPHDNDLDIHSPTNSSAASSDSIVTPIAQDSNELPVSVDLEAGKREMAQDNSPAPTEKSTEPRTDSNL